MGLAETETIFSAAAQKEEEGSPSSNKRPYKVVDTRTDDLSAIQEGEVVVNQRGQFFRARKTIYPSMCHGGPHGLGEPDDLRLRTIERDVAIPKMMNEKIEKEECRAEYAEWIKCVKEKGSIVGLQLCKPFSKILNECKLARFQDEQFRQKVTTEYLHERSEHRRTGMNKQQREFQDYLRWKEQHPENGGDASSGGQIGTGL